MKIYVRDDWMATCTGDERKNLCACADSLACSVFHSMRIVRHSSRPSRFEADWIIKLPSFEKKNRRRQENQTNHSLVLMQIVVSLILLFLFSREKKNTCKNWNTRMSCWECDRTENVHLKQFCIFIDRIVCFARTQKFIACIKGNLFRSVLLLLFKLCTSNWIFFAFNWWWGWASGCRRTLSAITTCHFITIFRCTCNNRRIDYPPFMKCAGGQRRRRYNLQFSHSKWNGSSVAKPYKSAQGWGGGRVVGGGGIEGELAVCIRGDGMSARCKVQEMCVPVYTDGRLPVGIIIIFPLKSVLPGTHRPSIIMQNARTILLIIRIIILWKKKKKNAAAVAVLRLLLLHFHLLTWHLMLMMLIGKHVSVFIYVRVNAFESLQCALYVVAAMLCARPIGAWHSDSTSTSTRKRQK